MAQLRPGNDITICGGNGQPYEEFGEFPSATGGDTYIARIRKVKFALAIRTATGAPVAFSPSVNTNGTTTLTLAAGPVAEKVQILIKGDGA